MARLQKRWANVGLAWAAVLAGCVHDVPAGPLPMLTSDGPRFVDAAGKPVTLRGCNLGNWLILESWMFGGTLQLNGKPFKDQASLFETLDHRFGLDKAVTLMDVFRASYVTPRDFEVIKSFGFNVVRLPFDYRALLDDAAPDRLRPDSFHWLDRALDLAEQAGVYVILDLHGVPGGQSMQDHTGQADVNRFWHDKALQERTVAIWKAIAERYKRRNVIAAYDLINEPYSDFKKDVRPQLLDVCTRIAKAVRAVGDEHVIFFPGALNRGIAFYGDPRKNGLRNIGFTEHYYPGLYGSKPALETHARLLGAELPVKKKELDDLGATYLVGEFNVVLQSEAPTTLMRTYYDRYAGYGWAATMWSYKLLKTDAGAAPSAWYMVTNADALPTLDVAMANYDQIEQAFRDLATAPLAVNEPLRAAMTARVAPSLPLAKYTSSREPAGDTSKLPAGESLLSNGSFEQQGASGDRAAGWNRWGDWINRENTWMPTHDGKSMIGYHHWQIDKPGSSGIWQDVSVDTGKRYTFTLFAQHDSAETGATNAGTLEVRLESVTPDGQVTLNTHDGEVKSLAAGSDWTRLSVSGTAVSGTLRVLAVINAAERGLRGGTVKLDDATVRLATDGH